jgi:hypothetical protein
MEQRAKLVETVWHRWEEASRRGRCDESDRCMSHVVSVKKLNFRGSLFWQEVQVFHG